MTTTILSQDTFTRANQSGLGTASDGETWIVGEGTATRSIVSNRGQFTGATGSNTLLLGTNKQTNCDLYVRFSSSSASSLMGLILKYSDTCNYIRVEATSGRLRILKNNLCVGTQLSPTTAPTILANTNYWLHVNCDGYTYAINLWQDGGTEPSGYQLTIYDQTFWNVAGQCGIYANCATAGDTVSFDSYKVSQLAQVGVSIAGSPVTFDEDSFQLHYKADERQRFQCTVLDYPGTARYTSKQQIAVKDPVLGTLFSGVLVDDKLDKTNTYPDATIEHQIDTVGNEYFADKRTSNRLYTTPTYAAKIVFDAVGDTLAAEGIVAPYAQSYVTTQADWATGTLANTSATNNVDDGDLELTSSSSVSQSYANSSQWNTGTLTNMAVQSGGDLSLNGFTRNWNDGSTTGQSLWGAGSPTQTVTNGVYMLTCTANSETRARLDFAGTWQNGTITVQMYMDEDVSVHSLTYRTTGWNNSDGSYAYSVNFSTNLLELRVGTNGGSGSSSSIVSTSFSPKLAHGWYTVTVVVSGSSHTVYLNGVQKLTATDSTYTAAGYIGLRNRNRGTATETMQFNDFGVMAALSGTWQSASTSINAITTIASSVIVWDQSLSQGGSTVLVQTSIDGGSSWQTASNGGVIPGLTNGTSGTGKSVLVKVTLSTTTASLMPDITSLNWTVLGGYQLSGTRTTAPLGWDSFTRANQSGLGTSTDGQTWNTLSGSGTLSITSNTGQATATTTEMHLQLGSTTGTDVEALVRVNPTSPLGNGVSGIFLRLVDDNNWYRLNLKMSSMAINKKVGGSFTNITGDVALAVTSGTWYWLRFRVQGTSLMGRMWPDNGSAEPTTWFLSTTDSSIASAGGFGLMAVAPTTDTIQYTNFRVSQYPDPALLLTPAGRVGSSVVAWNVNLPSSATTLGVDVSLDNGVTWTDVSAQNGGAIPGLNGQPDPTVDGFNSDTSANYISTIGYSGGVATWTYDTAHSRIVATNGASAIYLYNNITIANIDLFCDMDYADAAGMVFCYIDAQNYYGVIVADNQASIGVKNLMTLYKTVSGVQSTLATGAIAFQRGMYYRIRVTNLDGVITCVFDGVTIFTYTDSSPLGAGQVGLYQAGGLTTNYALRTLGPTLDLGTTSGIPTQARWYQFWVQPMGDSTAGKIITTRLRLATTDATVTPQVLDLTVGVYSNTIGVGALIPSADYRQKFESEVLNDVAKQSNYTWWIDAYKVLNFRQRSAIPAPWILQSTALGLPVDLEADSNLSIDVSNDLYRNRQWLTGVNLVASFTNNFQGDGQTTSFTLNYPVAPGTLPVITLNSVPQKVQQKGTTGGQWYFAYNDPVIAQDNSLVKLVSADRLAVAFTGAYTGSIMVESAGLQAILAAKEGGSGIVEAVEDVSQRNMTYQAAVSYAQQLITRYGVEGRTIGFATYRNGLMVGQILNVFLPEEGIFDAPMLILSIDVTVQTQPNNTMLYKYVVQASELPNPGSWQKLMASALLLT